MNSYVLMLENFPQLFGVVRILFKNLVKIIADINKNCLLTNMLLGKIIMCA
jgi:hypothetical protein